MKTLLALAVLAALATSAFADIQDSPSNDYGAVCFWVQAGNNEISYNRGINCRASSYDFGYDGGFVEVWENGDNSYIHHNYAQNTNGFFELGSGGSGGGVHTGLTSAI